jgi:hypothetical protein
MAFLAYDACMRVCLSAVLKDGAPWAKMFLGDGDTVPLQKCFALQSHLIQVRSLPRTPPSPSLRNRPRSTPHERSRGVTVVARRLDVR